MWNSTSLMDEVTKWRATYLDDDPPDPPERTEWKTKYADWSVQNDDAEDVFHSTTTTSTTSTTADQLFRHFVGTVTFH